MCEIASGLDGICDDTAGVETFYAFSVKNYAAQPTVVDGVVTAIELMAGKYAYPFNIEMETASFTDKAIGERGNSAYAREQAGTAILAGNTAEMIVGIEEMVRDRVAVIAKLTDATFELFFMENGAKVSDERATGTAYEDLNGNTLTFAGKEKRKAPKIPSNLVLGLLED